SSDLSARPMIWILLEQVFCLAFSRAWLTNGKASAHSTPMTATATSSSFSVNAERDVGLFWEDRIHALVRCRHWFAAVAGDDPEVDVRIDRIGDGSYMSVGENVIHESASMFAARAPEAAGRDTRDVGVGERTGG